MTKVKSSNLHSISYSPVDEVFSVQFNHTPCSGAGCVKCAGTGHTGQIYDYEGVDAERYAKVRDAESIGTAFHEHIKGYRVPETGEPLKFTKRPA